MTTRRSLFGLIFTPLIARAKGILDTRPLNPRDPKLQPVLDLTDGCLIFPQPVTKIYQDANGAIHVETAKSKHKIDSWFVLGVTWPGTHFAMPHGTWFPDTSLYKMKTIPQTQGRKLKWFRFQSQK